MQQIEIQTQMFIMRISTMKNKRKDTAKRRLVTPQQRLERQMSEVISLREKVAQAELSAMRAGRRVYSEKRIVN